MEHEATYLVHFLSIQIFAFYISFRHYLILKPFIPEIYVSLPQYVLVLPSSPVNEGSRY